MYFTSNILPLKQLLKNTFYQEVQFQKWEAYSELRRQYENIAEVLV